MYYFFGDKVRPANAEETSKIGLPNNKLSELRSNANLTQQALAAATGVNIRQIQKWESGELDIGKAAAKTVVKVAKALGTTVDKIVEAV